MRSNLSLAAKHISTCSRSRALKKVLFVKEEREGDLLLWGIWGIFFLKKKSAHTEQKKGHDVKPFFKNNFSSTMINPHISYRSPAETGKTDRIR